MRFLHFETKQLPSNAQPRIDAQLRHNFDTQHLRTFQCKARSFPGGIHGLQCHEALMGARDTSRRGARPAFPSCSPPLQEVRFAASLLRGLGVPTLSLRDFEVRAGEEGLLLRASVLLLQASAEVRLLRCRARRRQHFQLQEGAEACSQALNLFAPH